MNDDPFTQFALDLPKFPEAQCSRSDLLPDTWFPEPLRKIKLRQDNTEVAVAICFSCVHRVDCLQFALDNSISDGIWGGLLPEERQAQSAEKSKYEIRQNKLDSIRQQTARGMSVERACADVGLSTKTFERYRYMERAGWPPQVSNQRKDRQKAKDKK